MSRPSHYMLMLCTALLASFWVSGYLPVAKEPDRVAEGPVRIRLNSKARPIPKMTLVGSIRDTMGYLLPGAQIAADGVDGRANFEGRFWIDVEKKSAADLLISSKGYRHRYLRALPSAREALFVALEPFAPWDPEPATPEPLGADLIGEGFALDERGRALENAFVVVAETGATTRTNAAGQYRVALPAEGSATLILHEPGSVRWTGLAARSESFAPPRRSGMVPLPDIVGRPATAVRGTVRDADGSPLAGVPLQVICNGVARTIASGEGGTFRLGGLLPGRCQVRAFAFCGALGTEQVVDLHAEVNDCDLHLRSANRRRLRVVTPSGQPIARAIVTTSVDGLRRGLSHTDDNGWVDLRAALADASYEVRTADDYRELLVVSAPGEADQLVVSLP